MIKKVLIILGVLAGIGILIWLLRRHQTSTTYTNDDYFFSSSSSPAAVKPASITGTGSGNISSAIPKANDSIEANKSGVQFFNSGGQLMGTKNKGEFLGTVTSVDAAGPAQRYVYFFTPGGSDLNYVDLANVQVHNL